MIVDRCAVHHTFLEGISFLKSSKLISLVPSLTMEQNSFSARPGSNLRTIPLEKNVFGCLYGSLKTTF